MAIREPSTTLAAANPPSGSTLIKLSGGTFLIKMHRFQFRHSVDRWEDITGDGDTYFTIKTNKLQRGTYRIIGAMVTGAAMGLANLSSSGNASGAAFKVRLDNSGDAGSVHTGIGIVTDVDGAWEVRAVKIDVTVYIVLSNTNPATIEGSS